MRQLKITQQITARENDSLERYLQEVAKEDMISADQEVDLARRIKKGDQWALEKMTKANLRFVVSVAKQYQNQGLGLSDLINEGNIGLIKAAQRFDESKGFKFISYAVWWIRQSIRQALVENSRMVRLPLNKIGSYSKVNKMMVKFEQNFEREPTRDELADLMQITLKEVDEMLKGMTRHISIDAPINDNDDAPLVDLFKDETDQGAEHNLHHESLKEEIKHVLAMMNSRDAAILSCYFGVNGEPQMSLDEIGRRFNLTKERVRQIKEKAVRKLRKSASSRALKMYLGK
jgi:RNA polymerase primary sigma factor